MESAKNKTRFIIVKTQPSKKVNEVAKKSSSPESTHDISQNILSNSGHDYTSSPKKDSSDTQEKKIKRIYIDAFQIPENTEHSSSIAKRKIEIKDVTKTVEVVKSYLKTQMGYLPEEADFILNFEHPANVSVAEKLSLELNKTETPNVSQDEKSDKEIQVQQTQTAQTTKLDKSQKRSYVHQENRNLWHDIPSESADEACEEELGLNNLDELKDFWELLVELYEYNSKAIRELKTKKSRLTCKIRKLKKILKETQKKFDENSTVVSTSVPETPSVELNDVQENKEE